MFEFAGSDTSDLLVEKVNDTAAVAGAPRFDWIFEEKPPQPDDYVTAPFRCLQAGLGNETRLRREQHNYVVVQKDDVFDLVRGPRLRGKDRTVSKPRGRFGFAREVRAILLEAVAKRGRERLVRARTENPLTRPIELVPRAEDCVISNVPSPHVRAIR